MTARFDNCILNTLYTLRSFWTLEAGEDDCESCPSEWVRIVELMPATVITGGSGGLGNAIAMRFKDAGRTIVSLDSNATSDIADLSFTVDVADSGAVAEAFAAVGQRYGRIDVLVCASGLVVESPVEQMADTDWHAVIDASLTGAFYAARAALPAMSSGGSIIAFSSGYATSGYRNGANYAAAKAGVEALMKSIALEYAARGIRANCIAPGPIRTPMLKAEREAVVRDRIPMQRVGEPADIVGLVEFLASDRSAYITGQTIHVNGGLLLP